MIIDIAELAAGDCDDWLTLWSAWQRHMAGDVPADVTARTWGMLRDRSSGLHGLIARDAEGGALGFAHASLTPFAWTGGPVLYLQDLFVSEAARGQGVGEALLSAVYRLADRLGAAQVFWMVNEADAPLQRFYARHSIRTPYIRYMQKAWDW